MSSPPPSLVETMEALEDPRVDRTKLHPLTDILVLSVLAVICGADSFMAIAPSSAGSTRSGCAPS